MQLPADAVMISPSPSGRKMLVAKQASPKDPVTFEVWGGGRLLKEVVVPAALHGSVFNDGWFGDGTAWSSDETRVAYVAELPALERTPEWGGVGGMCMCLSHPSTSLARSSTAFPICPVAPGEVDAGAGQAAAGAAPKTWRGIGAYEDDWGELFKGKRAPGLFLLDLGSYKVQKVQGTPEDHSCGQPVWSPGAIGLTMLPFRS